ncbi:hypothetical protein B0H10DRAFT_1214797 [Mycena sp. CBHHK59/15]|nr:hypothetical protein B0H10DRAFT_1214797 [Mycena sp. CBHHK59/15]
MDTKPCVRCQALKEAELFLDRSGDFIHDICRYDSSQNRRLIDMLQFQFLLEHPQSTLYTLYTVMVYREGAVKISIADVVDGDAGGIRERHPHHLLVFESARMSEGEKGGGSHHCPYFRYQGGRHFAVLPDHGRLITLVEKYRRKK